MFCRLSRHILPYELWKASTALWSARVALGASGEKVAQALVAIENAEVRLNKK
jgi:hypothetical protein